MVQLSTTSGYCQIYPQFGSLDLTGLSGLTKVKDMAKVYNMHDAKSNLSKLIEEVLSGESVTIARAGQPLVDLTPHSPKKKFVLGSLAHLIEYNMTDEEEKEFFAPEPWDPWAGEDLSKW